jgi:hypothetical protein
MISVWGAGYAWPLHSVHIYENGYSINMYNYVPIKNSLKLQEKQWGCDDSQVTEWVSKYSNLSWTTREKGLW